MSSCLNDDDVVGGGGIGDPGLNPIWTQAIPMVIETIGETGTLVTVLTMFYMAVAL